MANVLVESNSLQDIADAIRTKNGTQNTYKPSQMADAIENLPSGGGTGTKQISITENGTTTEDVSAYASAEITVNVPSSGISIDDLAQTGLTGAVTIPTATSLKQQAFYGQSGITSIYAPMVTTAALDATYGCSKIASLRLPELTQTTGAAFRYMSQTSRNAVVVLPKISSLQARTFDRSFCSVVDLGPNLTTILADTFYNNVENQTIGVLILRYDGVVSASTTDAIKGLRVVYVPSAQIENYKAASKWADRFNAGYLTFNAIEGSQYENAYADGTPIS